MILMCMVAVWANLIFDVKAFSKLSHRDLREMVKGRLSHGIILFGNPGFSRNPLSTPECSGSSIPFQVCASNCKAPVQGETFESMQASAPLHSALVKHHTRVQACYSIVMQVFTRDYRGSNDFQSMLNCFSILQQKHVSEANT